MIAELACALYPIIPKSIEFRQTFGDSQLIIIFTKKFIMAQKNLDLIEFFTQPLLSPY